MSHSVHICRARGPGNCCHTATRLGVPASNICYFTYFTLATCNMFTTNFYRHQLQSTLVILKSNGLSEILRDIYTSAYQICRTEGINKLNNHISQMNMYV